MLSKPLVIPATCHGRKSILYNLFIIISLDWSMAKGDTKHEGGLWTVEWTAQKYENCPQNRPKWGRLTLEPRCSTKALSRFIVRLIAFICSSGTMQILWMSLIIIWTRYYKFLVQNSSRFNKGVFFLLLRNLTLLNEVLWWD